jgi:hypothetical protein
MRQLCVFSLVFVLCLLLGCSEDSPTGLDDDSAYTLEESETLGAEGGTIETDDFSLTVPAGAFDGNYTLELFASSEDRPFDQDQVTRAFRLKGLPDEFSVPLEITIKYEGTLSDTSFIALGARFFDYVEGDSATVFSLHPASDSSGFLLGGIPPDDSDIMRHSFGRSYISRDDPDIQRVLSVLGLTGYRTTQTQHFWMRFPTNFTTMAPEIGTMLEGVYTDIVSDLELPWIWLVSRLPVVVKDIGSSIGARGSSRGFMISQRHLGQGDLTTVRVDIGKQLLFRILLTYDVLAMEPDDFWLAGAVMAWSEEILTDDAGYLRPRGFPGSEMAPFTGMRAGSGDGSDEGRMFEHGRGMSAVIKYLADDDSRFGIEGIKDTYESIQGGSDPAAALLNNVNGLVADWWPDFFRDYVAGGIYGVGAGVFTSSQNLSGSWSVDSENDTVISFAHNYPDLSAKLYLIDLDYSSMDESASLVLKLTGELTTPVSLMVFRVDGASASYLGGADAQGSASLEVSNLRDLNGRQLLVVAVNSNVSVTYQEQSNLELEMKILTDPVFPGFDSFDFLIRVVGQWEHVRGDSTTYYDADLDEEPWGGIDVIPGEMTDENTFEGSFESGDASGEVTATFTPAKDSVTVDLDMIWTSQDGRQWSHSFAATGVPRSADLIDESWFRVDGAEACSFIDDVQYMYSNPSYDETRTLDGFYCTDQGAYPSLLILQFHKE